MKTNQLMLYREMIAVCSVMKTSQLMLYREMIAVCSKIQTKHLNKFCEQYVELLKVKPAGTYSNHWAVKS
jgi:hypothetical protein